MGPVVPTAAMLLGSIYGACSAYSHRVLGVVIQRIDHDPLL